MVHVLVHHKVADFYRWKESFDSYLNTRKQGGELGFHVFQSVDDPRDITVLVDWDSIEHARRFMSSEDLRNRMQQAGVVGAPDIRYIEDVHAIRRSAAD
jgi:quinol monooxygenase YgiN